MYNIINYTSHTYVPYQKMDGLKELLLLPGAEINENSIVNSSVWVFEKKNHSFQKDILGKDIGCGMTAFIIPQITNHKKLTDHIFEIIKRKQTLGRGNHFVDVCGNIESEFNNFGTRQSNIVVIHSDGKTEYDNEIISIDDAIKKQIHAEAFREDLGKSLFESTGIPFEIIGNWTHNSVEYDNDNVIYRKGAIKVSPKKVHILPAHVGTNILFYTVDDNKQIKKILPPLRSMPHGTGRKYPTGKGKVTLKEAEKLRNQVYIPKGISSVSLTSEHPDCYNEYTQVIRKLGSYMTILFSAKILGYVGKV